MGLADYSIKVTDDTIGDPREHIESGPILPYPNERMQNMLVVGIK
ncbi:MAG: hypothetical protein VX910_02620 [Candidatus Latescibacterota bacterium]|nr:hypothetical protein [Candidatus Latescibacterota bacterium]